MTRSPTGNLDDLAKDAESRFSPFSRTYEELNGRLIWNRNNDSRIPLCNFTARITSEEIHDDGAERKMAFVIEGKSSDGRPFPPAVISSDKYVGMAWVNASWGTRAIVYAGQNIKDHLRVAIQELSGEVPHCTVYTHTGWRKLFGKWVYLHAGGAIGESGLDSTIQVSPDDRLKHYLLPPPPDEKELREAIQTSLLVLRLAPLRISAPLFASIYRAPLGEAYDIDFSLFLSGPSGCQKSELSAIAQAHFGKEFIRTKLPGNWSSTGNSLERDAFLAKDAIFTVDDFAPTGLAADIAKLNKEADRLLRGQGNKGGRRRLTADAKSRPQYFPRGLIISSGEDIPRGPSLRARTLILEMNHGDVNLNILTTMQELSAQGALAKSISGYIQWLAPRMDQLKTQLPTRHRELREQVSIRSAHARTPELVVSLGLGLECFLEYAFECGAIGVEEKNDIWNKCWEAIQEAGSQQSEFQNSEDPTSKFLEMLATALVSGRAHLADVETGSIPIQAERYGWRLEGPVIRDSSKPELEHWRPMGDRIGWINGDEILLSPGASFATAQEIARKQNDALPTTDKTLWKRLIQKGIAKKEEAGKNTCKRTIMGNRQRVLVLRDKEVLYSLQNRGNGGDRDTSAPIGPECPQKVPQKSGELEKWGQKMGTETRASHESVPIVPIAPISQTIDTLNPVEDRSYENCSL